MPTLIAFAGLPGTGKTTVARELAKQIGAVYLRIDTIEQALRNSRPFKGEIEDAGYRAAIALAEENLAQGLNVVTDAVNPLTITRDAFAMAATNTGATLLEVELICSDQAEHRRRIETRSADIDGHKLPTWRDVESREYEPWTRDHLLIDTAHHTAEAAIAVIRAALPKQIEQSC
jgi:predicted kinase